MASGGARVRLGELHTGCPARLDGSAAASVDSRTIGYVLSRIGDLLALKGANRFQANAYRRAADAVRELALDDIRPLLREDALARVPDIGPSTLRVIEELTSRGQSSLLARLESEIPEGLIAASRIPGLRLREAIRLHEALGVDSLAALEDAALDGRLAALPRYGPKTVHRLLRRIALAKRAVSARRYDEALVEANRVCRYVARHELVREAFVAGAVRRACDVVDEIVVVACSDRPERVAADLSVAAGVVESVGIAPGEVRVRYVDGLPVRFVCALPKYAGTALWLATGSAAHVAQLPDPPAVAHERAVYDAFGLPFIDPELREGIGEIEAARAGALPTLVTAKDLLGVLHVHSDWSDGSDTIADLVAAARARGWSYIGISDHSRSAFYAGGLSREAVIAQHLEIDRVNAALPRGFRVLKGIEVDVLADGTLDYDEELLRRFDYIIASVHSRFAMDRSAMTARVLRALDSPYVTVLGHPTGRLLLAREPYDLDIEAVLTKAAAAGVAVELNADPARLDLSWRWCREAKARGCAVAIGPDAHSVSGLDTVTLGVAMARKAWLERSDILNSRSFAVVRRRRKRTHSRARVSARPTGASSDSVTR